MSHGSSSELAHKRCGLAQWLVQSLARLKRGASPMNERSDQRLGLSLILVLSLGLVSSAVRLHQKLQLQAALCKRRLEDLSISPVVVRRSKEQASGAEILNAVMQRAGHDPGSW